MVNVSYDTIVATIQFRDGGTSAKAIRKAAKYGKMLPT